MQYSQSPGLTLTDTIQFTAILCEHVDEGEDWVRVARNKPGPRRVKVIRQPTKTQKRQSPRQTPNLLVLLENAWTRTQFFHEELVGR
jgi:hypothetical protein